MLMLLSQQAHGSIAITSIEFDDPSLLDIQGNPLETASAGQQVLIGVSARNNHNFGQPYLLMTEVRDQNDITVYLALQNSYIDALGDYKMAASWIPTEAGTYTVSVFALVSLEEPQILSPVYDSRFTIE